MERQGMWKYWDWQRLRDGRVGRKEKRGKRAGWEVGGHKERERWNWDHGYRGRVWMTGNKTDGER